MAFRKLLHYLYEAEVIIKYAHAFLKKIIAHTLNSKVNYWGTEFTCQVQTYQRDS